MEIVGVRVEMPANTPVVVLREGVAPGRMLPILIGSPEAAAIHAAMEGIVPPRPLTHDLMVDVLAALGAQLHHVVVTEVRDHTFYAELHLDTAGGRVVVSSRPSDALALATRTGAEIFATEQLLDEAGVAVPEELPDDEEEAILDEFRDFLDEVTPEDFGS
jgi:bifunctional DNase/RNase